MPQDPELIVHKQWLGLLQPVGLVVSPPAIAQSQVFVNRDVVELQEYLRELVAPEPPETQQAIIDFPTFAVDLLGWEPEDLMPESELPENIAVPLPEYGETLKPTYGVPDPDGDGYLMLIKIWPVGENLDVVNPELENTQYWQASPEAKFERLLRETQIPVGLLCNGTHLRLVYAPRGESSSVFA